VSENDADAGFFPPPIRAPYEGGGEIGLFEDFSFGVDDKSPRLRVLLPGRLPISRRREAGPRLEGRSRFFASWLSSRKVPPPLIMVGGT